MLRIRVDIWIFFTYSLVFYGYLYTLVFFDAEASEPENVPNEIATPPLFHWLFAHIYWHCSPHADVEPEVTNHLFDLIISRVRPHSDWQKVGTKVVVELSRSHRWMLHPITPQQNMYIYIQYTHYRNRIKQICLKNIIPSAVIYHWLGRFYRLKA
jgi:hypothetical protein